MSKIVLSSINSDMVDWRVSSVNACVNEYLRNGKECGENDDVNVGGSGAMTTMMMMMTTRMLKLSKSARLKHNNTRQASKLERSKQG